MIFYSILFNVVFSFNFLFTGNVLYKYFSHETSGHIHPHHTSIPSSKSYTRLFICFHGYLFCSSMLHVHAQSFIWHRLAILLGTPGRPILKFLQESSRYVDYCNVLLPGIPKSLLDRITFFKTLLIEFSPKPSKENKSHQVLALPPSSVQN